MKLKDLINKLRPKRRKEAENEEFCDEAPAMITMECDLEMRYGP